MVYFSRMSQASWPSILWNPFIKKFHSSSLFVPRINIQPLLRFSSRFIVLLIHTIKWIQIYPIMKIQKLLVFVLLIGISYGWAQDFAFDEIPSELTEEVQAVVRYDRTTIEEETASRAVLKQQYAVTILEEDAVSYGFINIPYDKSFSKVRNIEAAIYDKNGKRVSKIKSNEFEDIQHSDYTSLASSIRLFLRKNHQRHSWISHFLCLPRLKCECRRGADDHQISC